MKPIALARTIFALILAIPALGCTWVPLTPQGQSVRILQSNEVDDCKKVGNANARTSARVVVFSRTDRKIREELDALARNQAAGMGGDAIVRLGHAAEGRQSFDVYRCQSG